MNKHKAWTTTDGWQFPSLREANAHELLIAAFPDRCLLDETAEIYLMAHWIVQNFDKVKEIVEDENS